MDYTFQIWRHAFYDELCVTPEDHPLLLTEVALTPKSNREKMAQIMFETFNVPALYVTETGLLSAYANCRTTAVSLSIGDTVTEVVPILDATLLYFYNGTVSGPCCSQCYSTL